MSFSLTKSFPRLWSLDTGVVMVVTDLHGDWDAYRRYRDRFVDLHAKKQADCLILAGDLIHTDEDPDTDQSLEMVLDVLTLRETFGEAIIYLCGNHEMPHIYGISLARGNRAYTPDFEKSLTKSQRRKEIIALFQSLPFYVRTRAGVTITHAGAPAIVAKPQNALKLFNWNHQNLLVWAEELLANEDVELWRKDYSLRHNNVPYSDLAQYFLDVSGPGDPRYNHLLRGFIAGNHPSFNKLLWPALFTRNEKEYGLTDFAIFLDALLQELSIAYVPQHVLVAGHMAVRKGHKVITPQYLRLGSAYHSHPREDGQYLLFDSTQPVKNVKALLFQDTLKSVFR